jgi:LPS sulfotransferase NodH
MSLSQLTFESRVQGANIDSTAWERETAAVPLPSKKYVIVFTARSGSSWLTSILSATNCLGYPEEYLNPNFVRSVAEAVHCIDPKQFLPSLQRRRQSANGVFGVEVREVDVKLMGTELFFEAFGSETVFFNLWRDNIIAQAVSLYRAVETRVFHSSDNNENVALPEYNADALQKWIMHLSTQENANISMLKREKRAFFNICYEQIIKNRNDIIKFFANALSVAFDQEVLNKQADGELKKIGDTWNKDIEKIYRAERGDFIAKVEAERLIKKLILAQSNGRLFLPEF